MTYICKCNCICYIYCNLFILVEVSDIPVTSWRDSNIWISWTRLKLQSGAELLCQWSMHALLCLSNGPANNWPGPAPPLVSFPSILETSWQRVVQRARTRIFARLSVTYGSERYEFSENRFNGEAQHKTRYLGLIILGILARFHRGTKANSKTCK